MDVKLVTRSSCNGQRIEGNRAGLASEAIGLHEEDFLGF